MLYVKVARKVLTETLQVKKGHAVTVEAWDNGLPFARHVVAEARAMGCTAIMIYEDEKAYVEGVRRAPADAVGTMGRNEYALLSGTDAYVFVPGQALGAYSKTLKPVERERSTRYNSSWYDAAEKAGLKGARLSFGYVGEDLARILGKKVRDVVKVQLGAALVDQSRISRAAGAVSRALGEGAAADLETERSSLTFSLKGGPEVEDGVVDEQDMEAKNNMTYVPPGFVTTEVDPASANGTVTLTDTLTEYGVIPKARVEFEDGKAVSWDSPARAAMKKLLDFVPPEQRRLKLVAIGLNPELGYGWGQDRFVAGSITLAGFGLRGQVKRGTLKVAGTAVVTDGRLSVWPDGKH